MIHTVHCILEKKTLKNVKKTDVWSGAWTGKNSNPGQISECAGGGGGGNVLQSPEKHYTLNYRVTDHRQKAEIKDWLCNPDIGSGTALSLERRHGAAPLRKKCKNKT